MGPAIFVGVALAINIAALVACLLEHRVDLALLNGVMGIANVGFLVLALRLR